MQDRSLRQKVVDELDFDPAFDAAGIGVSAEEGVITLTGHVSSYVEKWAAERAVRRVKGVRAIAQELEVRLPAHEKTADDEIAQRALTLLNWNTTIPRDAIQVSVQKGVVTLTGEVEWQFQKGAAEEALRRLPGLTGFVNHIAIKPAMTAQNVEKKIEDALARRAKIEADMIKVSLLEGQRVRLDGKVDCLDEREAVEDAVWSVAGVRSIDDQLKILRLR